MRIGVIKVKRLMKVDNEDGEIILGGIDKKYMLSNFSFFPVNSNAYWQIELSGIKVLFSFSLSNTEIILDRRYFPECLR